MFGDGGNRPVSIPDRVLGIFRLYIEGLNINGQLVSIPDRVLGIFRLGIFGPSSRFYRVSIPDRVLGIFRLIPSVRHKYVVASFNP